MPFALGGEGAGNVSGNRTFPKTKPVSTRTHWAAKVDNKDTSDTLDECDGFLMSWLRLVLGWVFNKKASFVIMLMREVVRMAPMDTGFQDGIRGTGMKEVDVLRAVMPPTPTLRCPVPLHSMHYFPTTGVKFHPRRMRSVRPSCTTSQYSVLPLLAVTDQRISRVIGSLCMKLPAQRFALGLTMTSGALQPRLLFATDGWCTLVDEERTTEYDVHATDAKERISFRLALPRCVLFPDDSAEIQQIRFLALTWRRSCVVLSGSEAISSRSAVGVRNRRGRFSSVNTVNNAFHCRVERRFKEDIRRKCPGLRRVRVWTLHNDDPVPCHRTLLARQFLARNNIVLLLHPSFSQYLASADFTLFPEMKIQLKVFRVYTITGIQRELQKRLDMLREEVFQDIFQKWQGYLEWCIAVQRNYFERGSV
ncbi:hypothetical protein PR048_020496 [Dryococelus australis]|uniref:Transposase n=1 Tax=Dryococelus australis TaxID=614101 RepID=A0ABQ9H6F8_9NEOP|nr:hypothetical protein PR048_020496 [Dryococelus australis]